eukprot:363952-Chlamydomonas_euryale.AAC.11
MAACEWQRVAAGGGELRLLEHDLLIVRTMNAHTLRLTLGRGMLHEGRNTFHTATPLAARLAGLRWYGAAQDRADWRLLYDGALPASWPFPACRFSHRHMQVGSAPCTSDWLVLAAQVWTTGVWGLECPRSKLLHAANLSMQRSSAPPRHSWQAAGWSQGS